MITYILRSSCFCEIWALCVSLITYDHLYIYIYIYIYIKYKDICNKSCNSSRWNYFQKDIKHRLTFAIEEILNGKRHFLCSGTNTITCPFMFLLQFFAYNSVAQCIFCLTKNLVTQNLLKQLWIILSRGFN